MEVGELMVILGPPAIGKMTVGRAVCAKSDFRLFHNHHMIEPLREVFDFGTPPFQTLCHEFRLRVMEEAGDQYRTNTDPDLPSAADDLLSAQPCLSLDNSGLTAEDAAVKILAWRGNN